MCGRIRFSLESQEKNGDGICPGLHIRQSLGFRRESGWRGRVWWAGAGEQAGQADDYGQGHYKRPDFFFL